MTKRERIREKNLIEIERDFHPLLLACLRQCAQGRYGLFGQNDHVEHAERYWNWPEAKRLKVLAEQIKSIRAEVGQTNETCERFLHLCSLRGANVPGEPKLATEFLADLPTS
jgi:hypothetical protein